MQDWKIFSLGELVNIKYGKNQKKVKSDSGKFPIYGTGGLMGFAIKFLYDKPSVLIGRKGSISKVKFVEKPFWTVDTLFYTEINENLVVPRFLYYSLSMIDLYHYNEGTTIPSLRTETLNKLQIKLPPLEVQKKIAAVLSALDDKIELNNKINKNLEQQAQAIFKDYYNHSLPKKNLLSIADIKYGKNLPIKKLCDEGYKVFGGNGIIGKYKEYLYKDPMIIISCRGAASGKILITHPYSFVTNNSLVIELRDYRYYEFLKQFFLMNQLFLYATGSAQPQITIENLKKVLVPYPDFDSINELTNCLKDYSDMFYNNESENERLVEMRDLLLPRLLNGEIDVSKVEI